MRSSRRRAAASAARGGTMTLEDYQEKRDFAESPEPPGAVAECGASLDYMLDVLPLHEVLGKVLTGSGECASIRPAPASRSTAANVASSRP